MLSFLSGVPVGGGGGTPDDDDDDGDCCGMVCDDDDDDDCEGEGDIVTDSGMGLGDMGCVTDSWGMRLALP